LAAVVLIDPQHASDTVGLAGVGVSLTGDWRICPLGPATVPACPHAVQIMHTALIEEIHRLM